MNFTNSPFEKMMKQVPCAYRPEMPKAPSGSPCSGCSYWQGMACVGVCYRELLSKRREAATSGQLGPKLVL